MAPRLRPRLRRSTPAASLFRTAASSVLDGDARDFGALQHPAHRFGLIAVEAGKAGPEQLLFALGDDRLGKRISLRQQSVGLVARRIDALQGFGLALQRADLNDPAGAGCDRLAGAVLLNGQRLDPGGWID